MALLELDRKSSVAAHSLWGNFQGGPASGAHAVADQSGVPIGGSDDGRNQSFDAGQECRKSPVALL